MAIRPGPAPTSRPPVRRLDQISEPRRRLVAVAHHIGFGWVEGLPVQGGEPRLGLARRVMRTRKFTSPRNLPRKLTQTSMLKDEWIQFFIALDELGAGTIERLDINDGLPTRSLEEVTMRDLR